MQEFSIAESLNDRCARDLLANRDLQEFTQCYKAASAVEYQFVIENKDCLFNYGISELLGIPSVDKLDTANYSKVVGNDYIQRCLDSFTKIALNRCLKEKRLMYQCYNPLKMAKFVELVIWKHGTTNAYINRRHFISCTAPSVVRVDMNDKNQPQIYFLTGPELISISIAHEDRLFYVEHAEWLMENSFPNYVEMK